MSYVLVTHLVRDDERKTLCGVPLERVRPPRAPDDQTYSCKTCDSRASVTRLEQVHEMQTPLEAVHWEAVE